MKTRNNSIKSNRALTHSVLLLGTGALALTSLAASAQMRGSIGGGMSGGSMSRGGSSGPSYSAPQSSARQSYAPSPSFSRPSYTPSYAPSSGGGSSYSRPGYTPSTGTGNSPLLRGGGSDPLFGRSAPASYNYGERNGSSSNYQTQNRSQYMAQGQAQPQNRGQYQGQVQGQAQTGRQAPVQGGRAPIPVTPGPGNYPNLRSYPITQMPLPQSRFVSAGPGVVNSLVTSRPSSFYTGHGLNGGNAYSSGYDPTNPYRYRYGIPHGNGYYYGGFGSQFFAGGFAYYPYYSPFFSFGYTALSPYAFYYGAFPSFITLGSVYSAPPEYVYVPYPVYQNGSYQGERGEDVDSYYLNRNSQNNNPNGDQYRVGENGRSVPAPVPVRDAALEVALGDIRDAWKTGKIDPLAKHVRRDAKVAVYLRGKYQYSLDAGDYLDMTRDALSATTTVRFELDKPQRKENGVYTITGRHIYRDKDGNEHTVHVTYVLEKSDMEYVLTQVGSAPDKLDEEPASSN